MVNSLILRELVITKLGEPYSVNPYDLHHCGLEVAKGIVVDVGALCFMKLGPGANKRFTYAPNSLRKHRETLVEKILEYANSQVGSLTRTSIASRVRRFRKFVFFCNEKELLSSYDYSDFRLALEEYVAYLRQIIRLKVISNNAAQRYQYDAIIFMRDGIELENIELGLKLIKKSKASVEHTEAPSEDDLGKALTIAEALFNTTSNAIINEVPFPLSVDSPVYLGRKNNKCWIFPVKQWANPNDEDKSNYKYYDYKSGVIVGVKSALAEGRKLNGAQKIALELIEYHNDYSNNAWHWLARIGIYSFAFLFASITGINKKQLMELQWQNSYVMKKESQDFIAIKRRANDKEVLFTIKAEFKRIFDRYIEMRQKITQAFGSTNYLFFCFTKTLEVRPLKLDFFKASFIQLQKIDANLSHIYYMQLRANKSEWLLSNKDIHTTAELLQNDVRTVQECYSSGTKRNSEIQMGGFFDKLRNKVKSQRERDFVEVGTGNCKDYGNPTRDIDTNHEVPSDCKKSEGCLMCDNYSVFADEKDVRKLLSCRFCIESTSYLSASLTNFENLYGEVLARIEYFLNAVSDELQDDGKLVEQVRKEVYEDGILDSYWEYKYEQLMELGIA
ncbi:hypothetical protein [Shewanella sp. Arc9-LZ]|uniref:hypothetical protein n=1 Tax=Shewanella sp. Arc9-LZ TaxID=2698686 RepID=UPI00137C2933|nr:hypothetical protein [Shewanella sp. Arc9-LZ]QHS14681.1 hypothetical protein GUY17_17035 [Shewanella sp. Arc9-LZ]